MNTVMVVIMVDGHVCNGVCVSSTLGPSIRTVPMPNIQTVMVIIERLLLQPSSTIGGGR